MTSEAQMYTSLTVGLGLRPLMWLGMGWLGCVPLAALPVFLWPGGSKAPLGLTPTQSLVW